MASEGDIRVLFVMNLVLSALFSYAVVHALAFVGLLEFTLRTFALTTLGLMVLTWLVVLR